MYQTVENAFESDLCATEFSASQYVGFARIRALGYTSA